MSTSVYQNPNATAAEKRRESARELLGYHLAGIRRWRNAHRRSDGHAFFVIPSSEPTADGPYYTDLHDCTCPSRQRAHVDACKHMLAVRLWMNAYKAGEITPSARFDLLAEAETIARAAYRRAWASTPSWGTDERGRSVWSTQQSQQEV